MLFQRHIPRPASLEEAREEMHGIIIRAGLVPVGDITAIWQKNLFEDKDDALAFATVVRKHRCPCSQS